MLLLGLAGVASRGFGVVLYPHTVKLVDHRAGRLVLVIGTTAIVAITIDALPEWVTGRRGRPRVALLI